MSRENIEERRLKENAFKRFVNEIYQIANRGNFEDEFLLFLTKDDGLFKKLFKRENQFLLDRSFYEKMDSDFLVKSRFAIFEIADVINNNEALLSGVYGREFRFASSVIDFCDDVIDSLYPDHQENMEGGNNSSNIFPIRPQEAESLNPSRTLRERNQ